MAEERILLVLPSLTAMGGGIELYCRQLIGALTRVRPQAKLHAVLGREATLAQPELLDAPALARLGVSGADARGRIPRISQLVAAAGRAALSFRPTLVVCGHVNYAVLCQRLAWLGGARLWTLLYGIEAWNVRARGPARALVASDRLISISSFTAAQVLRTLPLEPGKLSVLPNAVDLERFRPGAPSAAIETRLRNLARPRLLTVCRLDAAEAYKGVDFVIEALALLPAAKRPSYLMVGNGSDLPRLRALAAARSVDVEFYGRAGDGELPDLYRASNLYVMPSRNEGFGYVFIEAMACGLPVIAGCVDGSVDALAGGSLGLLVNPIDPRAIADAIVAQLEGRTPAALRDGARLRSEVASRFSQDAFDRTLAALFA